MPVYEYRCEACQHDFEVIQSLSEYQTAKIVCPKCGSGKTHQRMTTFVAVTSKKS